MNYNYILIFFIAILFFGCSKNSEKKKSIIAIPVYGQSLATGEEAIRITNFDTLVKRTNHLVLTENLDENFGYLADTHFKQWMKKILNDRHRAFEMSIYSMSEVVTDYFKKKGYQDSVVLCTFPGGSGQTGINDMSKGTAAYTKFLDEIKGACDKAKDRGWDFEVPAICWMQGEDDIVWKKSKNYEIDLKKFQTDVNKDIKAITAQNKDVVFICYQTNCLTMAKEFEANNFNAKETYVPEGQLQLVSNNPLFVASGPTYPYSFVDERVHIDAVSQKRLGYLAGLSVIRILESKPGKGLIPKELIASGNVVSVKFNVPSPPLVIDTLNVHKAANYGFSVIDSANTDILTNVVVEGNLAKLYCKKNPKGCKIRYAVNGQSGKAGFKHGPRGNLRDSQGNDFKVKILNRDYRLDNWCYQFDKIL